MTKTGLVLALVMMSGQAFAQDKKEAPAPKPALGRADETAMIIEMSGKELMEMAEDKQFPDAKLDYKPSPEVRSFAEQLLHAAKANMIFTDVIAGKKPDFSDLPRAKYKTRADIAKALKKSIDDLSASAKKIGDAGMSKPMKFPFAPMMVSTQAMYLTAVGHMSEHYGQLVVYYRLNKVVPPSTRNQPSGAP